MNLQNEKCVIVIDENLPLGIIANTAAILGITMGMKIPDVVGEDVYDSDGNVHAGIIQFPVPILRGNIEILKTIRGRLYETEFDDLTVVDFSDLAQGCKTYDEFITKMSACSETSLYYMGIAICGGKKKINKLTGNLPLLR
ncbi:MAG: DUF2000 domain-containing protein [Lachnospiraceae bacterium]|nr:DUF2000 domain-containing protein [Lachnospiraceae bacterium]